MSQKANPTLIGAFVLGAIAIALGAVIFFGSANLFAKKLTYLTYFDESVSGLTVGSNVKFKGVTIGKVTKVLLSFRGDDKPSYVKVLYEVDTDLVVKGLGAHVNLADPELNQKRVEGGLRAKLDFESLISGQLFMSLDYFKDPAPPSVEVDPADQQYLVIPSQPSDIQAILANATRAIANVASIDFLGLVKEVQGLLVSAREGIDALQLEKLGKSLNETSVALNNFVTGDELKGTLASLHGSFDELTTTLKNLDSRTAPALKNLGPTLEEAKRTMANLQKSTASLDRMLKPDSGFRYQLESSLSQLNSAASSIQNLSDFLQRHPNSILFGRKPAPQEAVR